MRRRAGVRATLVAAVATVSMVWPGSAMSDTVVDQGVRYVALGDSRAAGPYLDAAAMIGGCARSDVGYPALVAHALRPASFINVSCAAARTDNVTRIPQDTKTGQVPRQIDLLAADTTLVTLSIGGNDVGWRTLVSACYTDLPGGDAHCRSNPNVATRMAAALDALGPKVTATLGKIRQKAPGARVLLVGHGGIFGDRGCWPNIPTSDADASFVKGFFGRMNQVLAGAAANTGAEFVDVAGGSEGHDACAAPDQRWFEGQQSLSFAAPMHPTTAGMRHIAGRVVAAW
ncbi:SGNH/GDSL hydrolase family protein [Rhodococcus sp. BL-253-APC-6A1W]|uniref:SGNH/GDSL hydrolase family protein n=1 Tax=unclassified Rhodococcus (in: high G+C Gram-positive bacteria) TaxID=192944 RepID=UPI00146AA409|nr:MULTISPECIES: SGNH/GDSL hydrolase family protein [unclassified Rhodococcus (in: high G+C Gram-positive bacteria)]MBF0660162.1 SGNH/GDSL hydrolase family protein [Rhodococcus sp. (in: high G+C Gram-positive bacteria)]NMD97532.1 SGNH/GDSL hydrolase family protein [Rhodococcus sp. BL-253-APC-6A1W]